MARIRTTLEDDDGREINGDKERLYDLSLDLLSCPSHNPANMLSYQ
jgi:hypothetical protein